jgi:O-antigen/teichoic acid export membrane protein
MESRNKKLIKDVFIYGVGNLGAKLITFIIFPLYTFFIEPDNLGYFDNALATIFFLMPFVNLQLREGVFRFLIDEKNESNRKAIILPKQIAESFKNWTNNKLSYLRK